MPDITMCLSEDCPDKKKCLRHEAKPDPYRQSYFIETDLWKVYVPCKYYWPTYENAGV